MAIEASVKPSAMHSFDDDDDDDKPIVFKRSSNTTSSRNQSNSNTQKAKTDPSGKGTVLKSPLRSPDASGRISSMKSPVMNSKTSTSVDNRSKLPVMNSKTSTSVDNRSKSAVMNSKPSTSVDNRSKSPVMSSKPSSSVDNRSKSPVMSSKPSSSVDNRAKSPVMNLKASTSLDDRSKQSSKSKMSNAVKEESQSRKVTTSKPNSDDDDSEDDMPLTVRFKGNPKAKGPSPSTRETSHPITSKIGIKRGPENVETSTLSREGSSNKTKASTASTHESRPLISTTKTRPPSDESDDEAPLALRKENANKSNKRPSTSTRDMSLLPLPRMSTKRPQEESDDDEAPISSRLTMKAKTGTSGSMPACDEKKPLTSKIQQNGSTIKGKPSSSSQVLGKRPVDKSKSEVKSAVKSEVKSALKSEVKSAVKSEVKSAVKSEVKSEVIGKRPLDKCMSPDQASSKKPKLLGGSMSTETKHTSVKAEVKAEESDDDDNVALSVKLKRKIPTDTKSSISKQKTLKVNSASFKKPVKKSTKASEYSKSSKSLPSGDGQKKWTTLVHSGVIFPPSYKPHGVKILYDGKPVDLTSEQEEVATMFAVMKDTDYWDKPKFRENFWADWQKLLGKNHTIKSLDRCDFGPIYDWHLIEKEKKKQMTTEEKKAVREEKLKQEEKYMWAVLDGVKEKVGNFRVEPPGLFRGRGEHPKMGKLKKRILPSDITINIGKDAPVPECPIAGESWKEVRHDKTVTWLAFWNDPINQKEFKYVFLAASSSLKGQSDKEKYEKARKLKDYIKNIRAAYTKDFTHKDAAKRQIAVATYLIDKLALRAGNEKDDDEADTVGCCTLKVGNVECIPPNKLKFDFLGKDSIQYVNTVEVELPVYKAIGQFQTRKDKSDDLFDKLDTSKLNAHLKELMPGLTAKVFRTYNASITLDDMLSRETKGGDVAQKVGVYQIANKEVAIICNHQRTVSKSHTGQITRLIEKINELKELIKELKIDLDRVMKGKLPLKDADGKQKRTLAPDAIEKKISQTQERIVKIERDMQSKEDLKSVALSTSKVNYLDPRITVAWCKRHDVPIEKMFNKSLLAKFTWAMDVDPDFRF